MIDEDKAIKTVASILAKSPTSYIALLLDILKVSLRASLQSPEKYIGHMHILPMLGDYVPEGSPIARFWIDKKREFQEAVEDDSSGPRKIWKIVSSFNMSGRP